MPAKKKKNINNPYLEEYKSLITKDDFMGYVSAFQFRLELVGKYSWAIPDDNVIEIIKKYGPIIEIGAGSGYWAYILQQAEVDIIPYDRKPYNNNYCRSKWTHVRYGNENRASLHPNRSLMLCWPPYDTKMAFKALSYYTGNILIYIGEPQGGCTANGTFFQQLYDEWNLIDQYKIPKWHGLNDALYVYERKCKNLKK